MNRRPKLNTSQVEAIRADRRSQKDIAIAYGVSDRTVSAIKGGHTWAGLARPRAAVSKIASEA